MAIKITGNPKDVEKYRVILEARGKFTKGTNDHPVYDKKPDGYRIMQGDLKTVEWRSDGKSIPAADVKGKIDPDARLYIKGIANARIIDRVDEIVEPAGMDIRNFMKNRILLADHMYYTRTSIGIVEDLRPEHDGVHFEAWVGDPQKAPLTDVQRDVRSLIAQGILRTVSIGFIPLEIKAPEWDDQGKLVSPAIVTKWEMLELSIVAVPCNADATFEMRYLAEKTIALNEKSSQLLHNSGTSHDNKNSSVKIGDGEGIQTLIFDKKMFTIAGAKEWASSRGYRDEVAEETSDSIKLGQNDPAIFMENSFKTIEVTEGVKAVTGRLKDEGDMEAKLLELIEAMKANTMILQTVAASIDKSVSLSETMLGKLEAPAATTTTSDTAKAVEDDEDDEDESTDTDTDEDEDEEKSFQAEKAYGDLKASVETLMSKVSDIEKAVIAIADALPSKD